MKYAIPEISWHNKDPVLSVDFQPIYTQNEPFRIATGGTDSHVLIWYLTPNENGSVNLEVAADLTRHQKAVNVVRWSPSAQYLASGDDESIILVWKQNVDKETPVQSSEQMEEVYKESWVIFKTLRGHMEDVLDLSWSSNSLFIASGSVDNKLIVWDVNKGKYTSVLTDHKGFVQGVAWDPQGQLIATASSDRVFRTFDVTTKKIKSRSSKALLPLPEGHELHNITIRLYHDDTLQSFYRRLQFSPDGMFVAVPAGRLEPEQGKLGSKPINAVYIYTRYCLKIPACVLPSDSPPLVCRWCPLQFKLRPNGPKAAFPLDKRMVLAVATKGSVIIYDTQQKTPIGLVSNIHYTRLTDLTWSPDGSTLMVSSTDGFCSVITFAKGELGEVYVPEIKPIEKEKETVTTEDQEMKSIEKPEPQKKKVDPIDTIVLEDSEDIRLVYEDTMSSPKDCEMKDLSVKSDEKNSVKSDNKIGDNSDKKVKDKPESKIKDFFKQAKVADGVEVPKAVLSPKAPRRVSFVTLSSPKNSKKKL